MSGPEFSPRPHGIRRGAALTLVFGFVLATAAATNCLPQDDHSAPGSLSARAAAATVDREDVARAAAQAAAEGKSGTEAAEEVVSRSGDRWGAVYDKQEYEEFRKALDGEYTGVGLGARRAADGRVEVARVQRDSPAERAGIRAGDRLLSIDGGDVARRPVTEVVALLRGGSGTDVVLELERDGRRWSETLTRALLTTETVTVERLADDAVAIRVSSFTKGSGMQVRKALSDAPADAGVLLDLRGNAGGLVSEAVITASAFLDGGLVATYDERGRQRVLLAEQGGDTERPVVTLVDAGTMSAAELVAGALKDRGRAVTVGTRTFGKGSVQMPSRLPDGSVAELTVGHYRTPSGDAVDGKGITPDLVAPEGAEKRAQTVLSGLGGGS
ncbi:S41 family peptidase [Streptomyces peucetius]|uniref:S41 family peptidase n=1 Tax=Streptomyces peucetius TaxID=1950 RepID=A0ABY6I5W9_STRPE|nr:S41 family peptidase [Streptomyces peucetius]UYQ62398.1 S41 family peptidase [Streptomyces peucetius]